MKMLLLALSFFSAQAAFATLGESDTTVEKDRQAISGQELKVQDRGVFKIHEMTSHGISVREYVDGNGKVFALTWRGFRDPDLSILMGSYYQEYIAANQAKARTHGRQPFALKTANFTFLKSGHMRDLRAILYLNSQLPAGVKPEDIK